VIAGSRKPYLRIRGEGFCPPKNAVKSRKGPLQGQERNVVTYKGEKSSNQELLLRKEVCETKNVQVVCWYERRGLLKRNRPGRKGRGSFLSGGDYLRAKGVMSALRVLSYLTSRERTAEPRSSGEGNYVLSLPLARWFSLGGISHLQEGRFSQGGGSHGRKGAHHVSRANFCFDGGASLLRKG